jgi:hypothetical protein
MRSDLTTRFAEGLIQIVILLVGVPSLRTPILSITPAHVPAGHIYSTIRHVSLNPLILLNLLIKWVVYKNWPGSHDSPRTFD